MILTLCISALAFVMSGLALGFQIHSWRRSGPRVEVVRTQGIGATADGVWAIGVGARNCGRLGTKAQQFGFQLSNGQVITSVYDFLGQPIVLPMDLPPGGEASVMYSVRGVQELLAEVPSRQLGRRGPS